MENQERYKISKVEGLTPNLSLLACMMNQARLVTIESVKKLNVSELDFLLDDHANSIGALLSHIASTEIWYQVYTFEKRELVGEELKRIEASLDLGEKARQEIKGNEVSFYLSAMQKARDYTIREFRKRGDDWLLNRLQSIGISLHAAIRWVDTLVPGNG